MSVSFELGVSLSLRLVVKLLGDWRSRSGESLSPKREIEEDLVVKFNSSPRRGILVSGRKVVSPKRARLTQARVRGCFVCVTRSGELT